MLGKGSGNLQRDLNHMAPAAHAVRLGDTLHDLITAVNALIAAGGNTIPLVPNRLTTTVAPEIPGDQPT
jgi:hypothetical protein